MQPHSRVHLNPVLGRGVSISGMARKVTPITDEKLEVARRIRLCMAAAGMTEQRELARYMSVSDPTVHDWVTGEVTPRTHRLRKIAALGGETLDWILGRDEMEPQISRKLTRLAEIIGCDRLTYLDELGADELREMIDRHELERQRQHRRDRASWKTRASSGT